MPKEDLGVHKAPPIPPGAAAGKGCPFGCKAGVDCRVHSKTVVINQKRLKTAVKKQWFQLVQVFKNRREYILDRHGPMGAEVVGVAVENAGFIKGQ